MNFSHTWQNSSEVPNPQPEQLQYHRLLRGVRNYRWWKPLLFGLLAIVFGFTLTYFVSAIGLIPVTVFGEMDELLAMQDRLMALDTQDPYALALALVSLAVWIPAILLAALAMGFSPIGRLWSVAFKIRWGLLFRTIGPAFLALIFAQAIGIIYFMATGQGDAVIDENTAGGAQDFSVQKALISLLLILILVPLQATAEELMFRGAFMQVLGAWLKSPVIPILLPSLLFALAHLYDPIALVQVGVMGIVAGWLSWRTGGLEAAISLHVVNNLVAFLLLLSGVTGETGQVKETGADYVSLLIQVASFVFYAWLVLRITHKQGITAPMRKFSRSKIG